MSTENESTTPPEGTKEEPFDAERAKAKINKVNAEAAALRARLKETEADSAELAKLRDANKSEIEKANERAAQLEKRALEAETRALRLEVGAAKGLKPTEVKRLVGSTQAELEADADAYLAERAPAPQVGTRKPSEATRTIPEPPEGDDDSVEETDPAKLADAVLARAF